MRRKLLGAALAALTLLAFAGCGKTEGFDRTTAITVITREGGSGTRDAFIELTGVQTKDANGGRVDNTTKEAVTLNSTQAVMSNVTGNPYAIGYISLGSLNDTVKAVQFDGVTGSAATVKDGSYQLSRPFNIATKKEGLSELAGDFIDYILSADGQKVIEDSGYIAVSDAPAYSGSKPAGKIVVGGSSSVSPAMEKLKEAYLAINTGAQIDIQTTDSSSGMTAAAEGTCDIGMASRELKDSELETLNGMKIAMDGIVVIVNKDNPATNMTRDEVKAIFTGETTTWESLIKE